MWLHPDRPRCAARAARVSAACALLSCARLRAPQDRSRESAHHLGRSRGLELAIRTGMWGSWHTGLAVKSAGATFVLLATSVSGTVFRANVIQHAHMWPHMVVPTRRMFVLCVCQYT